MDHRLISAIEKALGWAGPAALGTDFARGTLEDPGLAERLMTPDRLLDLVMRRSLSTPQLRCFQDGGELHPNGYLADTVTRRGQGIRMVDMRRLGALFTAGATLVLDEVDFFDPTLEVACRALQWWSRELVQVNAYLTTQDARGFDLHWDDHDVLIVQLAGEKSWEVRGTSRPVPMYRDAAANNEPSDEVLWSGPLRAGDVMHIPRGHWHQATRADRGSGHSLHLTFGIVKRTGVTWLAWLADWCREDELFRRDLDRFDADRFAAQQVQLARAAAALAAGKTPADFLAAREHERPAARHLPAIDLFGPPSAVACVAEFPPRIELQDDTVSVTAASRKVTFAARALPALRLLLSGQPVNLAEASEATGVDAVRLADILIKEELCAKLTPELSSGYTGLVTSAPCSTAP